MSDVVSGPVYANMNLIDLHNIQVALQNIGGFAKAGDTMIGYAAGSMTDLYPPDLDVNLKTDDGNTFCFILSQPGMMLRNPSGGSQVLGEQQQNIRFRIIQGPGGPHTLSYDTLYDFGAAGPPVLSIATGATDIIGFEWVYCDINPIGKWCYLGAALGFGL